MICGHTPHIWIGVWVGGWVDGWVSGSVHIKSLKIGSSNQDN